MEAVECFAEEATASLLITPHLGCDDDDDDDDNNNDNADVMVMTMTVALLMTTPTTNNSKARSRHLRHGLPGLRLIVGPQEVDGAAFDAQAVLVFFDGLDHDGGAKAFQHKLGLGKR